MIKILRVFIGTMVGVWIAQHFLPYFHVHETMTYLWASLIIMATVFAAKGFNF